MWKENVVKIKEKLKGNKIAKIIGIALIILIIFLAIPGKFKGVIVWTVTIILMAVLTVVIPIGVEILIRWMADRGIFWVRTPENTALAIMRDRRLDTMLIAVLGEKRAVWQTFCDIKNAAAGRDKFVLMEKRGGLHYIGRPWVQKVYEWYETTSDEDVHINALHSIDLSETIISYPSADKDPEGVPNYESGDPVEVRSSLTFYLLVKDPEKALFAVPYRKEAIKKQVFPIWKTVLSALSFYEYATKEEGKEDVKIRGEILQLSSQKLKVALGLLVKEGDGFKQPDKYEKGSVVGMIEEEWGMWVRDVVVNDLEETGTKIRDALARQLEAKATALALVEEKEGQKKATILTAEGQKQKDILEGEGKSKNIELIGKALKDNPLVLSLEQIKGWDGKVPQVMGTGAIPFLNLNPGTGEKKTENEEKK